MPARPERLVAESVGAIAADAVARLRDRVPRVHCLTNLVATAFTANVLLAAGAIPSMTVSSDEIGAFAAGADALLVNMGTFDAERARAAHIAVGAARDAGRPWVLDPVFVERSAARAGLARDLLADRPAVIRLNAAELAVLAPGDTAQAFAARHGAVVAVTGAVDVVTDGERTVRLANGHPLMSRVTATGCAAGALTAAMLAVADGPFDAALAALVLWGVAGEMAGAVAAGPGTFVPHLIDAVHGMTADVLRSHARTT